jgi:hypothetical protein
VTHGHQVEGAPASAPVLLPLVLRSLGRRVEQIAPAVSASPFHLESATQSSIAVFTHSLAETLFACMHRWSAAR